MQAACLPAALGLLILGVVPTVRGCCRHKRCSPHSAVGLHGAVGLCTEGLSMGLWDRTPP